MALNINTLTIGSHVLLIDNEIVPGITYLEKGVRYKVTGIDSFNNLISLGDKYEERYGIKHALSFKPDKLDPIPITEELLTELGFGFFNNTEWIYDDNNMEITLNKDESDYWELLVVNYKEHLDSNTHVKYLHELEAFVYLTTKQRLI